MVPNERLSCFKTHLFFTKLHQQRGRISCKNFIIFGEARIVSSVFIVLTDRPNLLRLKSAKIVDMLQSLIVIALRTRTM